MRRRKDKRQSAISERAVPMRKFALASLVAFLGVGIAVHLFIARQVRAEHQDFAEFHAVFVTRTVLEEVLAAEDLEGLSRVSATTKFLRLCKRAFWTSAC